MPSNALRLPLNVAQVTVLAVATLLVLFAAAARPASCALETLSASSAGTAAAADQMSRRDEDVLRHLMQTAVEHQQQQPAAGILGRGAYEFYRRASAGPAKRLAQQQKSSGASQWQSLNGMWGKRDGGLGDAVDGDDETLVAANASDDAVDSMDGGWMIGIGGGGGGDERMAADGDGVEEGSSNVAKRSWKSLNGAWGKRSVGKNIGTNHFLIMHIV